MSEFINNFHLLRPWFLLLLFFPAILYWRYYFHLNTVSSWEKVCDKNLLDFLLVKGSSLQRKLVFYLGAIGMVTGIIALSGPSWHKREAEAVSVANPVMIVLNLSTDMKNTDVTPNRLTRAKYAVSDLLSGLKDAQAGLIVYTDEPYQIVPVTEDTRLINNLLPNIDFDIMPSNGDRLDLALRLAVEKLRGAGYPEGNIVVFSSDVGQGMDKALSAAVSSAAQGYRVNVVNVSAEKNEKLDLIARQGNGFLTNVNNIAALEQKINAEASDELKTSKNKLTQWDDYGYWLVFVSLICCLYYFRRGILAMLILGLMCGEASAGFFLNDNQEGQRAFEAGDFNTAADKFEGGDWKASSYYRLGDYEKAYREFSKSQDETARYNQGNALAKAGKIEEAIAKYEEVLQENPQHEDAKFNLEYLKQQQQQNQSSSSDNDENQNDEDNAAENEQQSAAGSQSEQQPDENERQEQSSEDEKNDNDASASENGSGDEEQNSDDVNQGRQPQADEQREQEADNRPQQGSALQNEESDNTYNEEVQAREMQYREIPEDAGGLLRAFIAKEYSKNRYAGEK